MASPLEHWAPPTSTRNLCRLVANLKAIQERRKLEELQKQFQNVRVAESEQQQQQQQQQQQHHHQQRQQEQRLHDDTDKDPSVADVEQTQDNPSPSGNELDSPSSGDKTSSTSSGDVQQPDPSGQQSDNNTEQARLPRFKGRLPSEVTIAELIAEFRALSWEEERRPTAAVRQTIAEKSMFRLDQQQQQHANQQQNQSLGHWYALVRHEEDRKQQQQQEHANQPQILTVDQWNAIVLHQEDRRQQQIQQQQQAIQQQSQSLDEWYAMHVDIGFDQWRAIFLQSPYHQRRRMIAARLHTLTDNTDDAEEVAQMLLQTDCVGMLRSEESLKDKMQEGILVLKVIATDGPYMEDLSLTPNRWFCFRLQEQKQWLGERLFPKIQAMSPDFAGKVTGMLLELDNVEVLSLLVSQSQLQNKVEEALSLLGAHQVLVEKRLTVEGTANDRPNSGADDPWSCL